MTTLIVIIVIIAALVIGVTAFKKKQADTGTGKAPEPQSKSDIPSPPADENEGQAIMNSLLNLNIMIRKDRHFPDDMVLELEAVIDDISTIFPAMMERYPGEALTYEIKKIGKNHLYKTVKEFLDLSLESRENQYEIFKKTIADLHEISKRSRDIVEKNEVAEFKTMANFLAGKFS